MIFLEPDVMFWISDLFSWIRGGSNLLRRRDDSRINESMKFLVVKEWDELCTPCKIIFRCKFDREGVVSCRS